MFATEVDYPVAVASPDDEGIDAAIRWCIDQMEDGDRLSIWTSQKNNLGNVSQLQQLVASSSSVEHVVGEVGARSAQEDLS